MIQLKIKRKWEENSCEIFYKCKTNVNISDVSDEYMQVHNTVGNSVLEVPNCEILIFFHLLSENKNVTVAIPYVYSNNPNPCAAGCKLKADIAVPE